MVAENYKANVWWRPFARGLAAVTVKQLATVAQEVTTDVSNRGKCWQIAGECVRASDFCLIDKLWFNRAAVTTKSDLVRYFLGIFFNSYFFYVIIQF